MFLNGCPLCGYSASPTSPAKNTLVKAKKEKRPSAHTSEALPAWAYIASIIVLLGIIAVLSYFITR